jgi:hypothetical protein
MARLRAVERAVSGDVPVALLDHDSPVWHDAALFERWMQLHVPGVLPYPARRHEIQVTTASWCARFSLAVTEWATANDLSDPRHPRFPDRVRLAGMGIRPVSALERARASKVRA